jgi:hypothetical protein
VTLLRARKSMVSVIQEDQHWRASRITPIDGGTI